MKQKQIDDLLKALREVHSGDWDVSFKDGSAYNDKPNIIVIKDTNNPDDIDVNTWALDCVYEMHWHVCKLLNGVDPTEIRELYYIGNKVVFYSPYFRLEDDPKCNWDNKYGIYESDWRHLIGEVDDVEAFITRLMKSDYKF